MGLENDIVDIQDNLILKRDGSVFAIYEVEPYVVNMVDHTKKEKVKGIVSSTLYNIKGYRNFDIVTLPFSKELLEEYRKLSRNFASDTEDLAWYILEESFAYLQETQELCEYKDFICVPLKSLHITVDVKQVIKDSLATASNYLVNALGFETNVFEGWEKHYLAQLEELEKNLNLLQIRRLTTQENILVNRYCYLRSLEFDKEQEITLVENYIGNLSDMSIGFEHLTILTHHTEYGIHYSASLPVVKLPENMSYFHFVEKIKGLGFSVEIFTKAEFAKTKGTFINNLKTRGRIARANLKNTQEEAGERGSVGKRSIARSKYLVENMEQKIDDGIPMISYVQTVTVFDKDISMLKRKINLLLENTKNYGVGLSRASADQLYLFGKNKFGELLSWKDKVFLQPVELGGFVENLFFTKRKVGQDVGFYFAKIDKQLASWHSDFKRAVKASSMPSFIDIFMANKEDLKGKETSNPSIQVAGDTGEGKSFLVSYIHLYSSLLKAQTLYIDPKCEKRGWYMKVLEEYQEKGIYPEIQSYIRSLNFVTLDHTKEENLGALDPIVFLSAQEAKDLIVSMIDVFMPLDNEKKFRKALLSTIDKYTLLRAQGEQVGTLSVFEELKNSEIEEVRDMAELLMEEVKNSILSLVFSDGKNPSVSLTARNTILEVKGLDLPNNERASLTFKNKKSLAVMYALGHFCLSFAERDYSLETLEVFDEAWFVTMTTYGQGIIDRLRRMGRSQNNFLVYVSQEVDDSDKKEDGTNAFGTYFCFKNDYSNAAEKVLTRLKVEITEESIAWYNNLSKAQCLFKDTFGRVERITVDGFLPEINRLFETVKTQMEVAA